MENTIFNKSYLLLENKNLLTNDAFDYLKSSNDYNLKKDNVFFKDIIFINITRFYDKEQLIHVLKNNILSLTNTKTNKDISFYIIPVTTSLDDYIEMILPIIENKNYITYLEFINFETIPKYLFDIELLLKYNINIGSNNNIFNT